jgi:Fe2+ transport system protein FeoA
MTKATYEVLIEDSKVAIRKEEAETIILGENR